MDFTFVRADFKDLEVAHMKVLTRFCRQKMLPLLEECFTKQEYQEIATKPAFESYFRKFEQAQSIPIISPYDMPEVGKLDVEGKYKLEPCRCKKGHTCCHTGPFNAHLATMVESSPKVECNGFKLSAVAELNGVSTVMNADAVREEVRKLEALYQRHRT
jgi:hypothetical protein